jgi:hypothetical protein
VTVVCAPAGAEHIREASRRSGSETSFMRDEAASILQKTAAAARGPKDLIAIRP